MNEKIVNTGGSAFPTPAAPKQNAALIVQQGMTLRDYFAAKAMQGLIGVYNGKPFEDATARIRALSQASYGIADTMLATRA